MRTSNITSLTPKCGIWFELSILFSVALRPNAGHGLLILEGFYITHNDATQSVGLLWKGDQLVAETST